jgi:hypothetical protein
LSRTAFALVAALGLTGCFQTHRLRADAAQWKTGVRTVAVLPAVHVYEVSVGDVREEKDEWTAQAEKNVIGALAAGLRDRGLALKVLKVKGDEELEDVRLLYEAVGTAIWRFTYPPYASAYKVEHFDYSVGPIGRILDRARADVLLVLYARDSNSTTARKITSFFRASNEFAMVTLGLIDRRGRIVWFDVWGGRSFDLRNEADVREIVEHLLANLPEKAT